MHHAGNSSGVVDGASAVLVASPDYAKSHGLKPRARVVMSGGRRHGAGHHAHGSRAGCERCVKKAEMTFDDIDLFEINEAFAVRGAAVHDATPASIGTRST